jgi:TolB-like protein
LALTHASAPKPPEARSGLIERLAHRRIAAIDCHFVREEALTDRPLASYSGDDRYFFVSYGHDDTALVHAEMRALQNAGFNLWYDEGIHVGAVWRQAIADALSHAAGIVFFATRASVGSDNCLKEINFALDEGTPIFVVKLDDTKLPATLRLALSDRQMLSRTELSDEEYRSRLIGAMSAIAEPASPQGRGSDAQRMPTQLPIVALQMLAAADDDTAFWAQGLIDDLATMLGHRWFSISVTHDQPRDLGAPGRAVNVRYVVSGSVRRSDERWRVNLKLSRGDDGTQLWSGRYDESGDSLKASDSISRVAAIDLSQAINRREVERVVNLDDEHLEAYGLCMKSLATFNSPATMQVRKERLERLRLAVQRDPDFAMAHVVLGSALSTSVTTMFSRTPTEDVREALEHVGQALALAPGNPIVMHGAVMPYRVFGDEALALNLAERANVIGGTDAFFGGGALGNQLFGCLVQAGRVDEAIERMRDSQPPPEWMLHVAYAVKGDWREALTWAQRAVTTTPLLYLRWAELANALAMLGRIDEARDAIVRVRGMVPTFKFRYYEKGMRIAWRNREPVVESQLCGLRKLGID